MSDRHESMTHVPSPSRAAAPHGANLDPAHTGDIRGGFGTIRAHDIGPRHSWAHRLRTLLAILGPGLIVMVGDNDAGAFSTYAQAGQNYGTMLLWTLVLLIPVLYVNQEMVLRLGAVTGVGHARLILERFGKFWGAFSVIDLFILNALTVVTEFIGISIGLGILGVPRTWGVLASAALIVGAVSTGNFRRFERFALALVAGSLLLVPIFVLVHPSWGQIVHGLAVPQMPPRAPLADVMLLIIAIVGTTVAPWQLFFQQSYVIDKRIGPRFIRYERADLVIGIVLVIVGAVAIVAFCAQAFAGTSGFGQFSDAGDVAVGLARRYGAALPGVLFAIALIDASLIGAAAVSLSSAYAIGDVLSLRHSLHRSPRQAKTFYAVYCCLIATAAALVLIPHVPLGLLTNAVQTMAGILLPSASVFLLLLCNDQAVLGPWINSRGLNLFTMIVVGVLVTLSVILTAAVIFPKINSRQMITTLIIGAVLATVGTLAISAFGEHRKSDKRLESPAAAQRESWRMPPLEALAPPTLTPLSRFWLIVLRSYLVIAVLMVIIRVTQVATATH